LIRSQKDNPTLEDRREEKQGKRKPQRVFVRREFDVVSSGIGSTSLKAISIDRILSLHERVIFKCERDATERYRELTAASEGRFESYFIIIYFGETTNIKSFQVSRRVF